MSLDLEADTLDPRVLDGPIDRGPSTHPSRSLGPLGWLAVLLAAVTVAVLAHVGNLRASERDLVEPGLGIDPAYVLEVRKEALAPRPAG